MQRVVRDAKARIRSFVENLEDIRYENQRKVLRAFQEARVGSHCFFDSTGYGYHDGGRDALEAIFATVFCTDSALVRPMIVSGTHAITLCLSLVQPGEELVSLSGAPYDTLQTVIGTRGSSANSLIQRGVLYKEVPLHPEGSLDFEAIERTVSCKTKMVLLQRSRGYSARPSILVEQISKVCALVKRINPQCIFFVDNCYGEFVELREPTEVGADLMAGSLIKNPGGTLAPSGGYIVGKRELVFHCGERLTAPGLGAALGPTFGLMRPLMQGFFVAPHMVGEALYGAILASAVFTALGYATSPKVGEERTDIIQMIEFGSKEKLLAFCHEIQRCSPVDSHCTPIPSEMPGYEDPVVMAGGTFIQGSSLELSADAPLRPPYRGFLQGGMGREHIEIALSEVVATFKDL